MSYAEIVEKYKSTEERIRKINRVLQKYSERISNILFGGAVMLPLLEPIIPGISKAGPIGFISAGLLDRAVKGRLSATRWAYFTLSS